MTNGFSQYQQALGGLGEAALSGEEETKRRGLEGSLSQIYGQGREPTLEELRDVHAQWGYPAETMKINEQIEQRDLSTWQRFTKTQFDQMTLAQKEKNPEAFRLAKERWVADPDTSRFAGANADIDYVKGSWIFKGDTPEDVEEGGQIYPRGSRMEYEITPEDPRGWRFLGATLPKERAPRASLLDKYGSRAGFILEGTNKLLAGENPATAKLMEKQLAGTLGDIWDSAMKGAKRVGREFPELEEERIEGLFYPHKHGGEEAATETQVYKRSVIKEGRQVDQYYIIDKNNGKLYGVSEDWVGEQTKKRGLFRRGEVKLK